MWKDDPHFTGMFVRQQYDQLLGSGGLWETAGKYYPLFKAKSVKSPVPMYTFPAGSRLRYKAINSLDDAEKMRGLQLSYCGIDELTQQDPRAVQFLLTCLRSEANMNSVCVATCNPNRDSWVFDLVSWYLDEKGFVDQEKNGKIRYYVVKDGNFLFADEESWFLENMPEVVTNAVDGSYIPPKRFSFVQLTIFSNKILLQKNPRYLSELQNLPPHERDAQLYGNWYAKAMKPEFWRRDMVRGVHGEKVVTSLPPHCKKVLAFDKAITEYLPKINNTDCDFTASIHLAKDRDGLFYIYGNYCPENYDEYEQVYGKFRKNSGDRDRKMLAQAEYDGTDVQVVIARDAGADGLQVFQEMAKKFIEKGFKVSAAQSAVTSSKFARFEPFLMACQAGFVRILENTFDPKTLEAYYKELETFAPTLENGKPWRSNRQIKDDWVDCTADAYSVLSQQKVYTVPKLSVLNDPTIKKNLDL